MINYLIYCVHRNPDNRKELKDVPSLHSGGRHVLALNFWSRVPQGEVQHHLKISDSKSWSQESITDFQAAAYK
jgi:hypothetical protein